MSLACSMFALIFYIQRISKFVVDARLIMPLLTRHFNAVKLREVEEAVSFEMAVSRSFHGLEVHREGIVGKKSPLDSSVSGKFDCADEQAHCFRLLEEMQAPHYLSDSQQVFCLMRPLSSGRCIRREAAVGSRLSHCLLMLMLMVMKEGLSLMLLQYGRRW